MHHWSDGRTDNAFRAPDACVAPLMSAWPLYIESNNKIDERSEAPPRSVSAELVSLY